MSDSADAFRLSLAAVAAEERARIEKDADQRIASIVSSAEAEAAETRERAFALMERELAEETGRLRAEAEAADRAAILEAKWRLIDETFAAAAERLKALSDGERYKKAIARLSKDLSVDNSIATRLDRSRNFLLPAIAAILFREESD